MVVMVLPLLAVKIGTRIGRLILQHLDQTIEDDCENCAE
jgi:hypothetical protein